MSEKIKDYRNYNGQTALVPNIGTGELESIFVMASSFTSSETNFNLSFDGWRNTYLFDDAQPSSPILNRTFVNRAKEDYATTFEAINQKALDFLEASGDDYSITQVSINIGELQLSVNAEHKRRRQFINRFVTGVEEFETVKAENMEFVGILLTFMWTYGKTNDAFLRNLKPLENGTN